MDIITIRAKLLAYREDYGGYVIYVFENLDSKTFITKYQMVTKFPNWETPIIEVGDVGYLNYRNVVEGEDTWWDKNNETKKFYKYTNSIFEDFILEKPKIDCNLELLINL